MTAKNLRAYAARTCAHVCMCCIAAGVLALVTAAPAQDASSAPSGVVTALDGGIVVERELLPKQAHHYQIALAANEYVQVIVEPRGIDVGVQVRHADGRVIAEIQDDLHPDGHEHVDIVADAAADGASGGVFTLAVRATASVQREPGSYTVRIATRRTAAAGDRSMQQARMLAAEANRLTRSSRPAEARPLFERALAVSEATRGPEDAYTGRQLFALADNALDLRDAARAELLFDRAIRIFDRTYGAEHPWPAMARARLALAYERRGRNAEAEVLLRQAIEIIERTLGAEHLWYAQCLTSLGNLRGWAGDLGKAEEMALRAMDILDRLGETGSTHYAGLLNNLANLEVQKRNYPAAETLFLRALALNERNDGPDSFTVSITCQNLGAVARERKNYPKAIEYATRALSIRERLVGADHPDIAQLLNNLANIRNAQGDTAGSLELHFRALRIQERMSGPYGRGTLVSVGNIARRYAAIGDIPNAVAFQRRADTILDSQLRLQLAVGSERQKLAFMKDVSERTDRTISLSLREAAADPDARALASLVLLQRKGRVLDTMIDMFASVRLRSTDDADRVLLDQLVSTSAQFADLALNTPANGRSEEDRARLTTLEEQRERLEAALSTRNAEFRVQLAPVTLDAVQAAIPADGVLVELAIFRPFDPKAERNTDAYGPPHYAAYVLRRDAPPRTWDLGPAAAIDESIDALRQALRDRTRTDLAPRARAVYDLVIRPIETAFGGARHLLISPDGALNLVPFEAMLDTRGRYLIERYAISYLSSGRDLLRRQAARASRGAPVIVADPFFGETREAAEAGESEQETPRFASRFAPLSVTAAEARQIQAIFPEATLLTQRGATKAALARLEGPRLLHIASHGFFAERAIHEAAPIGSAGTRGMRRGVLAEAETENPLLRSGLALAGANAAAADAAGDDDGILTALEASGLNLWGTKLVTLSACDTGIGEVRNGEGVYGLRRAFLLAGAESMVMSLWPVSDYVTRKMMTAYYTGLRAGLGRGEALRRAKLAMIARDNVNGSGIGKGRPSPLRHPFFWASFIQSGEWAPLDGLP